jgi:hypothetical protein
VREFQNAEDAKEQSFNSRAAGLTGFVGIVVTLASGAGKLAIDEGIDGFAAIAAGAAFTLALVGLALAIGIAVVKVLIPPESSAIGITTIQRYPTWQYISKEQVMVRGEIMKGLIKAVALDRQRNSDKAKWLKRAYRSFLFGAFFLASTRSKAARAARETRLQHDSATPTGGRFEGRLLCTRTHLYPRAREGDPKYEGAPVFGGRRPFALFSLRLTRRRAGDEPIAGGGKRLYSSERVPNRRGYGRVSRRGPG